MFQQFWQVTRESQVSTLASLHVLVVLKHSHYPVVEKEIAYQKSQNHCKSQIATEESQLLKAWSVFLG